MKNKILKYLGLAKKRTANTEVWNSVIARMSDKIPLGENDVDSIDKINFSNKVKSFGYRSGKVVVGAACLLASVCLTLSVVFYTTIKLEMALLPSLAVAFSSVGVMPLLVRMILKEEIKKKRDEPCDASLESFA